MQRRIKLIQLDTKTILNRIANTARNAAFLGEKHFNESEFLLTLMNLEMTGENSFSMSSNKTLFEIAKKIGCVSKFETYER